MPYPPLASVSYGVAPNSYTPLTPTWHLPYPPLSGSHHAAPRGVTLPGPVSAPPAAVRAPSPGVPSSGVETIDEWIDELDESTRVTDAGVTPHGASQDVFLK